MCSEHYILYKKIPIRLLIKHLLIKTCCERGNSNIQKIQTKHNKKKTQNHCTCKKDGKKNKT